MRRFIAEVRRALVLAFQPYRYQEIEAKECEELILDVLYLTLATMAHRHPEIVKHDEEQDEAGAAVWQRVRQFEKENQSLVQEFLRSNPA